MTAVIAGDLDKLGFLYDKYKLSLYAYFYRLTCGDGHSSEDLVHTVFYRVIKYKDKYKGSGTFSGWLFTIAHNAGMDFARKEKNIRLMNSNYRYTHEDSILPEDPENDEKSALLFKALSMLKPDEREILILSKQDCIRYKEIARILNCRENAVKIRVFRALKKLKEIYDELENS
jgi:RNA polymerase sigma factor (sigma-70 family)